ncbi:MAG: cellulose biosynthesis protein BcsG [Gallionellaceae bacterium]|nr:cellulose biosynthesis protein BcsG [Gallionellaceae bacterium]
MGPWNFYFIAKLFLYFGHYIDFHVVANLVFAALLAVPLRLSWLRQTRLVLAAPTGAALLYHDTWLPSFSRLVTQVPKLEEFDLSYLVELLGRVISIQVVVAIILLYIVYYFAEKKIRVTPFVFVGIMLPLLPAPAFVGGDSAAPAQTNDQVSSPNLSNKSLNPPTSAELSGALDSFYDEEAARYVSFTPPEKKDAPFDIVFLHICSLSWDDLNFAKEQNNPLFKKFNIVFTNFNAVASYSGPAVDRVLQGSCGQPSEGQLQNASSQCQTFDRLRQVGFEPQLTMNHDGHFENFLTDVKEKGGIKTPPLDKKGVPYYLVGFDGSFIYDDYATLAKWWKKRLDNPSERVALYYNTISLHDGNHYLGEQHLNYQLTNSRRTYHSRLNKLIGDLDHFFSQLEASGRRVIVVFIPEHGAATRGDRMQIPGMREIPTPEITLVPVGVKLIGMAGNSATGQLVVSKPTSYLAVTQLLSDFVKRSPFGASGLEVYTRNLPVTEFVAENDKTKIMRYGDQYFIRNDKTEWEKYISSR